MDLFDKALQTFTNSGPQVKYFRLAKAGDEAVVRILISREEMMANWGGMFHTVTTYRNGKQRFIPVKCYNENDDSPNPGECPVCSIIDANGKRNYPGPMAFVPIQLLGTRVASNPVPEVPEANDQLRIWQMRKTELSGLGVVIKDRLEEDETFDIDRQDFRVQRLGEKAATTYYFAPKKVTPLTGTFELPDSSQYNKYTPLDTIKQMLGQSPTQEDTQVQNQTAPPETNRKVNPFI